MLYFQKNTFILMCNPIKLKPIIYFILMLVLSIQFVACGKIFNSNEFQLNVNKRLKHKTEINNIESHPMTINKENINFKEITENKNLKANFLKSMEQHVIPLATGFAIQITTSQMKIAKLEEILHQKIKLLNQEIKEQQSKSKSSKGKTMNTFFKKNNKKVEENIKPFERLLCIYLKAGFLIDMMHELYVDINSLYMKYITSPVISDEMFYTHLISYRKILGCLISLEMSQSMILSNYISEIKFTDQKETLDFVGKMLLKIKNDLIKIKEKSIFVHLSKEDLKFVHGVDDARSLYLDVANGYYYNNKFLAENISKNLDDVKVNKIEIALLSWITDWARFTSDPLVKKKDTFLIINKFCLLKKLLEETDVN